MLTEIEKEMWDRAFREQDDICEPLSPVERLERILEDDEEYIEQAFLWEKTPQKDYFWQRQYDFIVDDEEWDEGREILQDVLNHYYSTQKKYTIKDMM